jgi:tyrosine-protein kinase Etk/Wzc
MLAPTMIEPQASMTDSIDLSQILRLLRRDRRWILGIAAALFTLAMAFALLSHMRFVSSARMYLGELEDKGRPYRNDHDDIDLSPGGHGDIGSEVEILKSRSLVTRAILATGLNTTVTLPTWGPPRYWRWLWSRRSDRLLDVAAKELAAVDTSLSDRSVSSAVFNVRFDTDLDYEVWSDGVLLGRGKLGDPLRCQGLSIRLVPGTERGPSAGARYEIEVQSLDDTVESALKSLDVSTPTSKAPTTGETVKVANLHFSDRSPRKAASFLEHLMLGYLEERQSWKTQNASAAETFLTSELGKTRETLDDLQNKVAQYRATSGVVVLDDVAKTLVDQLGQYEEQRINAGLQVDSLAAVNDQLKRPNPPVEAHMLGEAKEDSVLTGLATSLSQSQQKLAEAETLFNAPAPSVQHQRAEVDAQLQAIRSYVGTRLARARANVRALDNIIGQYQAKLKMVPNAEVGLARLTREIEVYRTMYSLLLRHQQEAALVKASTISQSRVLDPPEVPYREEKLRLGIGLASAPLGILLGALVVLMRSVLSGRIQHTTDVRRYLGPIPVLATIPHITPKSPRPPEYVEAFRTLRANVYGACRRDRGNVVLFTSPCSGDGKTTCAYFLASVLARSGRTVLLVDTGLRRDSSSVQGGPAEGTGLGDVLTRRERWRDVLKEVHLEGSGFDVIGRGRKASNDLLSSAAMREFIADVREIYEFVLLEAPSYPAVSDSLVLSAWAECIITVIRFEHTSRALAADNVKQLSASNPKHAIVLNDARS